MVTKGKNVKKGDQDMLEIALIVIIVAAVVGLIDLSKRKK